MFRFFFSADRIFEKSGKYRIFKKSKFSIFRKSKIFKDFSKIRDFQIFRKFDQLKKKNPIIKKKYLSKSQNFIEIPFRNTQQRLLTPPERGERAISTWSSKWFLRNFRFWLNLCTHTCCFPSQFSLSKLGSMRALQKTREPRIFGVG